MSDAPRKICIFTLGCKVNLYDSDAMLAVFKEAGFEVAEGLEYADVYILNTCAVTREAEKKSRQSIARVKKINPNARIFVCGCASQRDSAQFEGKAWSMSAARRARSSLQGTSQTNFCAERNCPRRIFLRQIRLRKATES